MTAENPKAEAVKNRAENAFNVSFQKPPNFYVFLGKKFLREHGVIELHAQGSATTTCVIVAGNLEKYLFDFYFLKKWLCRVREH